MKSEKNIKATNGYVMLTIQIILIAILLVVLIVTKHAGFLIAAPFVLFFIPGFFIVNPNSSRVLVLFGAYKGTIKDNGFFWANGLLCFRKRRFKRS